MKKLILITLLALVLLVLVLPASATLCTAYGGSVHVPAACSFIQANQSVSSINKVGIDSSCGCGRFNFAQNASGNPPYYTYEQDFSIAAGVWSGTFTLPSNSSSYQRIWMSCTHSACPWEGSSYSYDWGGWYIAPGEYNLTADFNGTPVSGTGSLYVAFVDTSSGVPIDFNWSATPSSGAFFNTPDAQDTTALFHDDGNYTITHCISDGVNSDCEIKTDYIWVYNSTSQATTYVTAIDAKTANPIPGSQIDLYDVENTSCTNTTTGGDGTASIVSLAGHTIDGYASASGYDDNDYLGMAAGSWYSILMFSPFESNVTLGNVTLYVNVQDSNGHAPISGAGVTVVSNTSALAGYTNDAGIVSFAVQNKTSYLVDVEAVGQGYSGATQSVYSGTGSGGSASVSITVYLAKKTVTPTVTMTIGPGGTTPVTVDPYPCDADHPENCQRKQTDMANSLIAWGPELMSLFILATIFGVLRMMGWK